MQIIDGKLVSKNIRQKIKEEVSDLKRRGINPGLAVILVGDDPASKVYVKNKKKACEEVGIRSEEFLLKKETSQESLISLIDKLNHDPHINGILVQLPLPSHIDEKAVIGSIFPEKDVDGFHEQNVGKVMIGNHKVLPCTPAGIMELLRYENINLDGKHCVVVGRSNIVGKPMAMLMLHANATVTICHSHTKNIKDILKQADVIVVAVGKPNFLKADMIKENAVIIDVGINRDANNKLTGDVDFDSVKEKASFITPVPGGVGPMTITMLLENTVKLSQI